MICGRQLENMNENQNKPQFCDNDRKEQVLQIQKAEMFSGPVPPPEIIEKYERIYPGAKQR